MTYDEEAECDQDWELAYEDEMQYVLDVPTVSYDDE